MGFLIREATEADVPEIMVLMEEARSDTEHPEWFAAGDVSYIRGHLEKDGFVLVAQTSESQIAGFFVVIYPKDEENLGHYLEFDADQLAQVAMMDTAVVGKIYRGNGLQAKMLEAAEARIDKIRYPYLMCTIHPDNRFSRHNMESYGYEVKTTAYCYGGFLRYVFLKNFKNL